jgi:hypothetical protein
MTQMDEHLQRESEIPSQTFPINESLNLQTIFQRDESEGSEKTGNEDATWARENIALLEEIQDNAVSGTKNLNPNSSRAAPITTNALQPSRIQLQQLSGDSGIQRVQIQRNGDGEPAAPGLSPELVQQIAYAQVVLSQVPPLPDDQVARLNKTIAGAPVYELMKKRDAKRTELEDLKEQIRMDEGVRPTEGREKEVKALTAQIERMDESIQASLGALNLSEADLAAQVEDFVNMWVARGKEIALTMLSQQEQKVNEEANRYETEQTPMEGTRTAEAEGLKNADAKLLALSQRLKEAKDEVDYEEAIHKTGRGPDSAPGGSVEIPVTPERIQRLQSLRAQLAKLNTQMKSELQRWGAEYPILMSENYTPGAFASLSPKQVARTTGGWIEEIKDNITETKGNIEDGDIKVWDLKRVPEMAYQSLRVSPNSLLGRAVQEHIEDKKSDAKALDMALTVLQVATIVAAAAVAGPAGAALMSAGWGIFDLVRDIDTYLEEKAAENVALDPALRDISELEPSLIPIAIDLITLGLDIVAVPRIVKSLKGSITALRSGRKSVKSFIDEAVGAGMSREQAERIAKRYGSRAPDLGEIARIAEAMGDAGRHATMEEVLGTIKKYANKDIVDFLKSLRSKGKIVILPADPEKATDVLMKRLGEAETHKLVQEKYLKAGGFYHPNTGIIFAKQSNFGYMQSIIVHEAVHALQHKHGKSYYGFVAEFQALVVQRNYLNKVAADAPVESLPDLGWLVNTTDDSIMRYLETHPQYGYAIPDKFSVWDTVADVINLIAPDGKLGRVAR